eukprot:15424-Heterococcus_DN1.PRE.5
MIKLHQLSAQRQQPSTLLITSSTNSAIETCLSAVADRLAVHANAHVKLVQTQGLETAKQWMEQQHIELVSTSKDVCKHVERTALCCRLNPLKTSKVCFCKRQQYKPFDLMIIDEACNQQDASTIASSVIVVTPNHVQRRAVRQLFNAMPTARAVLVETVENCQGKTADLVIMCYGILADTQLESCCDFLFTPSRLNVSLSRARAKVIVLAGDALVHVPARFIRDGKAQQGYKLFLHAIQHAKGQHVQQTTKGRAAYSAYIYSALQHRQCAANIAYISRTIPSDVTGH